MEKVIKSFRMFLKRNRIFGMRGRVIRRKGYGVVDLDIDKPHGSESIMRDFVRSASYREPYLIEEFDDFWRLTLREKGERS